MAGCSVSLSHLWASRVRLRVACAFLLEWGMLLALRMRIFYQRILYRHGAHRYLYGPQDGAWLYNEVLSKREDFYLFTRLLLLSYVLPQDISYGTDIHFERQTSAHAYARFLRMRTTHPWRWLTILAYATEVQHARTVRNAAVAHPRAVSPASSIDDVVMAVAALHFNGIHWVGYSADTHATTRTTLTLPLRMR